MSNLRLFTVAIFICIEITLSSYKTNIMFALFLQHTANARSDYSKVILACKTINTSKSRKQKNWHIPHSSAERFGPLNTYHKNHTFFV